MTKRKHIQLQPDAGLYHKRSRPNQDDSNDDTPSSHAKIDPTYGQRNAFPGLSDNDDGLFYGPASDGMDYLRMVRLEAKTVPNLLVAPLSPARQAPVDDLYAEYPRGYYADGAYTALPGPSFDRDRGKDAGEEDLDPQEAYYASLCARFEQLSSVLERSCSSMGRNATDEPIPRYNSSHWRNKILKTTPQTSRLARLPQDMVMRGLAVLEKLLDSENLRSARGKNVGAWAWGLLGRCREVGQMSSEDVAVLRCLGKRAVWLLRRVAAGKAVAAEEEVEEEDEEEEEEEEAGDGEEYREKIGDDVGAEDGLIDEEEGIPINGDENAAGLSELAHLNKETDTALQEVKARMLADLNSVAEEEFKPGNTDLGNDDPSPQCADAEELRRISGVEAEVGVQGESEAATAIDAEGVHATLDMLVTIIGEFYGQKDLLNGRLLWDEIEGIK